MWRMSMAEYAGQSNGLWRRTRYPETDFDFNQSYLRTSMPVIGTSSSDIISELRPQPIAVADWLIDWLSHTRFQLSGGRGPLFRSTTGLLQELCCAPPFHHVAMTSDLLRSAVCLLSTFIYIYIYRSVYTCPLIVSGSLAAASACHLCPYSTWSSILMLQERLLASG